MKEVKRMIGGMLIFSALLVPFASGQKVKATPYVDGTPVAYNNNVGNMNDDEMTAYDTWRYYQSEESTPCSRDSGGKLISFTERHKRGKKSGNVKSYPYYLYSKYTGSSTVEKIKSTWKVGCNLKNSATISMSANVGAGETTSVGASASGSSNWQWKEVSKYYYSTNGSKLVYSNSNFTVAPYKYSDSGSIYLTNESYLKIKGDNQPYSISSGC